MIELALPAGQLTVLCLGAHPDDIEIGCGATLLRLAARRPAVQARALVLTGAGPRIAEARAATPRFLPGTQVDVRELRDGRLPAAWEQVKQALHDAATTGPQPDLIFAPRPDDAHQDHRLIGELVATVWRDCLVLHYEIPKWDGDLGRVDHYVPISAETARRKVELLDASFPSQRAHDWWDAELFLATLRLRGVECHSRYAEGFLVGKAVLRL